MTLKTRKPTGLPSWPIMLIAGTEKSGKSYAAAAASASDLIGRTLWVAIGEDDPDELGAVPGARFEIVPHAGTYRSILSALDECVAELAKDEKPGLIVVDSMTRLWNLLCDEAQVMANKRAEKKGRKVGDDGADITMDLWNAAAQRWHHVMDCLREHRGPSIVTARQDVVTVLDDQGRPTKEKDRKIQGHKTLPFDVGAIVELPAPGEAVLTGVRSLRIKNATVARRPLPGFTVDTLWREMGMADDAELGIRISAKLEIAIKQDPKALEGSAYTSLGSLYYQVPGWPVGFGDDEKAEKLLKQALAINPTGIDPNFFYGDFLLDQGDKAQAKVYLDKALAAPARPGREVADEGRRMEIRERLAKL